MKRCVHPLLALAFLAGAHNLEAQNKGLSGAIFTTLSDGSTVNANQYSLSCSVYLDGGPGMHAPAKAAGLPDGDYYFQVTNPSGSLLFSTDPVSNRRVRVANGVFVAYTGFGGPPHPTGLDQDHPELGAITIGVANTTCPNDFLLSPEASRAYKVWVTPVASFLGDPAQVDNPCSGGCFHGFVASTSKTDNFTLGPSFCLTLQKQFLFSDGTSAPGTGWEFDVTDTLGVVNSYFMDDKGQTKICGLTAGAYTVAEDPYSSVVSLVVNGVSVTPSTIYSFTWKDKQPDPVIRFVNLIILPE
jgi:hypothetical protein